MIETGKVLVIDIDGTLCSAPTQKSDYSTAQPYGPMIEKLRDLKQQGFYIVLQTSRQMRTYEGNVGKVNARMLPILIEWLNRHQVPYDEIHVGKPWCGHEGYYVDDKSIRPSEFLSLTHDEITDLLDNEKERFTRLLQRGVE